MQQGNHNAEARQQRQGFQFEAGGEALGSHVLAQAASKGTAMQKPGNNAKAFGSSQVVHKH
jgi:hypothetical protein